MSPLLSGVKTAVVQFGLPLKTIILFKGRDPEHLIIEKEMLIFVQTHYYQILDRSNQLITEERIQLLNQYKQLGSIKAPVTGEYSISVFRDQIWPVNFFVFVELSHQECIECYQVFQKLFENHTLDESFVVVIISYLMVQILRLFNPKSEGMSFLLSNKMNQKP